MQAARRSGPIGSYLGHALADPEPRSAETAAPRPGAAYPASVVTLAQLSVAHPPALGAGRCLPRTRRGLSPAQCGPPTRPRDRCCLPRARCDLIPTKFGPPTLGAGAAYPAPVVALVQRGVAHLPAHQAGCWLPRAPLSGSSAVS